MKLWRLEPTEEGSPRHPKYDSVQYFIVRASTEAMARQLASEEAFDEKADFWLNPAWSTCEEYTFPTTEGDAGVVLFEVISG